MSVSKGKGAAHWGGAFAAKVRLTEDLDYLGVEYNVAAAAAVVFAAAHAAMVSVGFNAAQAKAALREASK